MTLLDDRFGELTALRSLQAFALVWFVLGLIILQYSYLQGQGQLTHSADRDLDRPYYELTSALCSREADSGVTKLMAEIRGLAEQFKTQRPTSPQMPPRARIPYRGAAPLSRGIHQGMSPQASRSHGSSAGKHMGIPR